MAKYMFLTEEWVDAAKAIREEHAGDAPAPAHVVRMNQIITEVPFSEDPIHAHIAKAILVEGNPQAGMQAFMAGKIKVEGDMTKLMAMSAGPVDPAAAEVAAKIQDITE